MYVADIGTDTVYKFDANGNPVNFTVGSGLDNALQPDAATPAGSFSFPTVYGTPAAIAVDNSCVQHTPALTGRPVKNSTPPPATCT